DLFTQIFQASGLVIHLVQFDQAIPEVFTQLAALFGGEVDTFRHVGAGNDADQAFHHIELAAEHTFVIAERHHVRHIREDRFEFFHHAVFATHVVGGFGFLAKRRTAQNVFLVIEGDRIRQVGRAAWKLLDAGGALHIRHYGFDEAGDHVRVELFAFANFSGLIQHLFVHVAY